MGVLDRFERGIEKAVNGVFARAFKSEVQPVEIASALRRAMDDRAAVVGRGRTLVPNSFVVELGPGDYARLSEYTDVLTGELIANVTEHADVQQYAFPGPVSVALEERDTLETGVFQVRSASVRGVSHVAPPEVPHGPGHPAPATPPTSIPAPVPAPAMPPVPAGGPVPGSFPLAFPSAPQPPAQPNQSEPNQFAPAAPPAQVLPPASPEPAYAPAYQQAEPAAPGASAGYPLVNRRPWLDVDGHAYPLLSAVTVIGRGDDADVILDDPGVSRRHAEVRVTADGPHLVAHIRDLGSTNGTFVDGGRVTGARLIDGNAVTLGRTRLTYRSGER